MSKNSIRIGITDGPRYPMYERWFLDAPESIDVIRLSYKLNNIDDVERCQGVVLSGGEDVNPIRYKRGDLREKLSDEDIDDQRDEFEWQVMDRLLLLKLPILGICRGMQIFNVFLGGTLFHDIPTLFQISSHAKLEGIDQIHEISVDQDSLLSQVAGVTHGEVNSSHHQAVEIIADDLVVSARAEEPIIEAMEWKHPEHHSFYLGVQWHPERMINQASPFSYNIRQAFIQYIFQHQNQ